jgi:hypothetical protein
MGHGDVIHQLVRVSFIACHLERDVDRLGQNRIALRLTACVNNF